MSSSRYTLQADLIIYVQIIYSREMVCEGQYLFPINTNSHYYILQKYKSINTFFSLLKIINGNVNVICYDLKDIFPLSLRSISQNYCNKLPPQHIPMAGHDNVMDEKTMRKSIEFKI